MCCSYSKVIRILCHRIRSKTLTAKKAPIEQDRKEHQSSKANAPEAIAQITALREKTTTAYANFLTLTVRKILLL